MPDRSSPLAVRQGDAVAGGITVTVGLLVLGVSSYGFLAIASRSTTPAQFSAVAALWSLVYALVGVFTPLEQETTRAVAQRRARGQAIGPVAYRVAALGAVAAVVVALGLVMLREPLTGRILGGHATLVVALIVTLVATGGSFVLRGILAGTRRYRAFGGVLAGEGLLRLLGTAVLAATLTASAGALGAVLAVAAVAPQVVGLLALPRHAGCSHPGSWSEVTANLGWLVCASVVSQAVANAGPVVLQVLGPTGSGEAGRFLAAFVLVRIPLFFVSALQASLLPRLVQAVESDDHHAYRRALRQMLRIVGGLGALALAGFTAIGPAFVTLLLGRRESLDRLDLLVLGLSSVLLVLASLLQSAVLALGGHRGVAACWGVGGAVFVACCLMPVAPLLRLEIAYVLSSAMVPLLLTTWLARTRSAGAGSAPDAGLVACS